MRADLQRLKRDMDSSRAVASGIPYRAKSAAHFLGITAAALIVALAGSSFLYFYFHRTPKLTDKDVIVLADFVNSTGDPVFDDTLKQGLAVQLGQSPLLNILPEQKVRSALKEMTRSPDETLSAGVAQEVCQRTGGKAYIAGSIGNLAEHYVIGLNAIHCATGDTLAREQAEAAGKLLPVRHVSDRRGHSDLRTLGTDLSPRLHATPHPGI
jgi:hypothetical protein